MAALVPAIMVPTHSSSSTVLEKQGSSSSPQLLDELYTLLRADSAWTKERAVAIIQQQSPEELYSFMRQLLGHCSGPRPAVLSCSSGGGYHGLGADDDTPDSPTRLAPATDQLLSPFRSSTSKQVNNTRSFDAFPQQDDDEEADHQYADSPVQHQQEDDFEQDVQQSDSPVQQLRPDSGLQQLLQEPRGRFLAESLDLNLGASFDLLSKASLADFSTAAAAASRLSTTALVRQSHMRVLSPVAEASFLSATAGTAETHQEEEEEEAEQHSAGSIGSAEALHAGQQQQQQGMYTSSHLHHQQQQRLSDSFSTAALETATAADADLCPSTCSSPREPPAAAGTGAATAAALRMSVAESANGWPSSQPLPFMPQDMLEPDTAADAQPCMYAPPQPAAAAAAAAAAPRTPGAAFQPAAQPVTPLATVRTGLGSTGPSTPSAGLSTTSSTPSRITNTKRAGGGPNPLGLITAPIHGANALRRSITRLWSGSKGASSKAKAAVPASTRTAAQPAPGLSSKQGPAPRTLACTSAPIAAVYGGGGPSSGGSKLPSFRQSPSPALRQPLQGFGITQQGSSPTKAAAAAVAASAAASSSRKAAGAAARTPQRAAGSGNIGYRPPSSAGRGTPTGTPGFTAAATGSRIPGAGTSSGGSSGYARAGSTPPSIGRQQQQQRVQLGHQLQQHHNHDRPSSQASSISYARSDASLTGTGSHTSVGPFQGGFSATRQALQGKATPTLKQPASRLQHKQQQAAASRGLGTTGAAAAQGVGVGAGAVSRGGRQLGGGTLASGIPGFSRQVSQSPAVGRQQGGTSAFSAASGRGLLAAAQGGGSGVSGGGGSRIGTGDGRSGLRRSRSCGSLAEMLNVSELRSMWKQREQDVTARQAPAAAAAAAAAAKHGLRQAGAAAGAGQALHAQSSIGRGTTSSSRQQPHSAARPSGCYQPTSRAPPPARAAAAGSAGADDEADLPVLSRCQSPTRPHGQDRAAGVGTTSAVLAEMGQVLSHMDTLIAGDTAAGPAGRSGGSSGSSWGRGLEPGRHQPGAAVGGVAQSPSALVYKLVKGAGSTAGAAAGATPAAERRAGHAAAAVGLGQCTQQMLVTPHGATGSSQVPQQQGGGTPHWGVYSAPPAAVAGGAAASSSSQEGQDLSRQLFS